MGPTQTPNPTNPGAPAAPGNAPQPSGATPPTPSVAPLSGATPPTPSVTPLIASSATNSIPSSATRDIIIHNDKPKRSKPIIFLGVFATLIIIIIAVLAIAQPWKRSMSMGQGATITSIASARDQFTGFTKRLIYEDPDNSDIPDYTTSTDDWQLVRVLNEASMDDTVAYGDQLNAAWQTFIVNLNNSELNSDEFQSVREFFTAQYNDLIQVTVAYLHANQLSNEIIDTSLADENAAREIANSFNQDEHPDEIAKSLAQALSDYYSAVMDDAIASKTICMTDEQLDLDCLENARIDYSSYPELLMADIAVEDATSNLNATFADALRYLRSLTQLGYELLGGTDA